MHWLLGLMAIPLTLFLLFIVPIWLWMHYRKLPAQNMNNSEQQRLQQLQKQAESIQQRIQTLETLLDAEYPNWRQNV